jgi:hypothetical protein
MEARDIGGTKLPVTVIPNKKNGLAIMISL